MRFLFILPVYNLGSGWGGGVARCMATLCQGLARQGVSVTVYTTDVGQAGVSRPEGRQSDAQGVEVHYFPSTFGANSMFDSRALLRRLNTTVKTFDVVYIAAWFMWLGIAAARICRQKNVPMVAGIHGGFTRVARRKSYLKKCLFRQFFLRGALRAATTVHLTCATEARNSWDWLEGRPIMTVPNCVDPEEFRPYPEARGPFRHVHGIPATAPLLISVTRFDWMKRVDLLMAALARLRDWHLVLVGDDRTGTAPSLKRQAAELGIADRVRWTGYLTGRPLCEALTAADVFALVSDSENFGNVVVEAMMCGLPVILSPEVGVCEFVRDDEGVFTCARSAESVADALRAIAERWVEKPMESAAIRAAAIDRFAPDMVARRFTAEIEKQLGAAAALAVSSGE